MTQYDGEWTRLPGLFRWSEVSDALRLGSSDDGEWRFSVEVVPSDIEPLFVVRAAPGPVRP